MFDAQQDEHRNVYHQAGPSSKRVLFIHGFTGSPKTLSPQYLAAIDAGYSVYVPLLSGHGTTVEDMVETRYSDYLADVETALAKLCPTGENVYVVAISMGGTLALDLALRVSNIVGMVLVNPLVLPPAPYFMELMDQILDSGIELTPSIGSDIADPSINEASYPASPVRAAKSLFEAAGAISNKVADISVPIRLYSSIHDHVVGPESGEFLAKVNSNVERVTMERSYHVATLDFDKDLITAGMLEFIEAH